MASIFISRHLEENSILWRLKDQGHTIINQSLIEFSPISYTLPKHFDWLFFYSKNGLKYGLKNEALKEIIKTKKIACFGPSVAKYYLKTCKGMAQLMGSGKASTMTSSCLEAFKNQKVLFLQANNSLSSIQKRIEQQIDCTSIAVYDNKPIVKFDHPGSDILIFTSPLNVASYLNQFPSYSKDVKTICIGKTTASYLLKKTNIEATIPKAPNEIEILNAVQKILSKRI